MALIDMVMPKMGESIMECTVITWLKQPGDLVDVDESVLEVATDKVDTEVPASHTGILKEILVNDGDVVAVGAPIARIETKESAGKEPDLQEPTQPAPSEADQSPKGIGDVANVPAEAESVDVAEDTEALKAASDLETTISLMSSRAVHVPKAVAVSANELADESTSFADRFYSPLVLKIAKEEGISRDELDRIPGSGAENRVTKNDILVYVNNRTDGNLPGAVGSGKGVLPIPPESQAPSPMPPATSSLNGQADIIQMDRMRKLIAQRMVESKQISPHVSSFVEADMTQIVQWRTRTKDAFKQQTGENLTYTPIFIDAIVKAIKDFPMINVSVDGDKIILKKAINIGMAVALPSGNLIVPVIHNADQYNLVGLTKKVNDLTKRARENKLTADDLAGGTYTISNIGTFGNLMGTPIILQPQVAIMAFGAIVKKPAVIETPEGDFIGIRQLMFLSHSYDHRVVDGSLGGQFIRRVADYLEKFDNNLKL
ncbi:dihydrolipoamide acetyltransferase family protein [Spirosoma endophyticum]|uniref:Dihydrolipoamide acetyltransferase component of pyruvate dehydrogenase complex n=1 Tax=Spirosoma endophyticum TaxID=662367 RepID=A0A1I2A1N2_9BACT|nr:dihydrolipoamide acetyltransferase family protein [Spirosoma endophyticum]SFE36863.1 2-oxoglutarate dehydrogenase E2 component (dihydrolipoamide succinyltransferase) [Spirosoma endophyticum]